MTMDRRQFVNLGFAAMAAARSPLVQPDSKPSGFSLEILFKGQFVYITEGRELYVSCLKNEEGHPRHSALVFVNQAALDSSRQIPAPDDQVGEGDNVWKGWNLKGQIRLLRLDSRRLRLLGAGTPARGKARAVPWPVPVNDDAKWNDHAYIPQLATISPGCSVKQKWRDECESSWQLEAAKLRPRKPCTPADVVGVWLWRDQGGAPTHLSAVTDLVSYPPFAFPRSTRLTLRIGEISVPLIVNGRVELPVVCAPARTNPPSRVAYTSTTKMAHFEKIYRVLNAPKKASMHYFAASEPVGSVQGTHCNIVFSTRDDDVFCPGGEPPPLP